MPAQMGILPFPQRCPEGIAGGWLTWNFSPFNSIIRCWFIHAADMYWALTVHKAQSSCFWGARGPGRAWEGDGAQHDDGIFPSKFCLRRLGGGRPGYPKSLGCRQVVIGRVRVLGQRITTSKGWEAVKYRKHTEDDSVFLEVHRVDKD